LPTDPDSAMNVIADEQTIRALTSPAMEDEALPLLDHAVSIVIPAYNEGPYVGGQIRAVKDVMDNSGWNYEIILVDDGSTDGTDLAAAAQGVRVIRHRRNRGYGAALKRGVSAAQFDWILITDADGTYPPEAIPELLAQADSNEMVVGARVTANRKIPLVRRPAKWFLARLASYLAERRLPDLNSGLRLMRKDLIETYRHLLPSGFSFTTTITLAAVCDDHEVEYVPIDYHARLGDSKIRPRHAYDFLLLILRTVTFFNPLRVFIPLGFFLALIGLSKFAYDVTQGNISESALLGLLGAMIIWSSGLLADQNARIARRR
jgi:glycosyltransferase involved in cell wall biosynthesis